MAAILDALHIAPAQYDEIRTLLHDVEGRAVTKTPSWDGVEVRVLMYDGGLFGGVKWITYLTREPWPVVSSTDDDAWPNRTHAPLARDGWYIHAAH